MAGSGNRDVSLVISARNQATAAIDSVAEALKTLAAIQNEVGESAENTDGLLGELTNQLKALSAQAKGLEALGTVAGSIDKAAGAVERLQNQLESAKAGAAGLAEQYAGAAQSTAELSAAAAKAKSELESQRAVLSALRAEKTRDTAAINAQKVAVAEAAVAWKNLQTQVRAASGNENQLSAGLAKSTVQVERQQAALTAATGELGAIRELAVGASAALGGVAASQEAVAAASARTAEELARVNVAIAGQGGAQATGAPAGPAASATAAYRAQVEAVEAARKAMQDTSAEATRLGAALATTEGPTQQLARDFVIAKADALGAEQAFMAEARALAVLRGASQGTFGAFIRNAEALERVGGSAEAAGVRFGELAARFPAMAAVEEASAVETETLGQTFRRLVGVLLTIPGASGEAEGGIRHLGDSSHGVFQRMRNELLYLTTAYVGFYGAIRGVEDVLKTYQTLQSAQQRLAVAFEGDTHAVGNEIAFVREQAERLGLSFNTLLTQYTRIAIAGKEAGYSADGTRKIFLAFAEAARVAGLSEQQLDSAFLGLREGIERGTINARNFNLEIGQNVPGAMQSLAQAAAVSVAKLTELQKSGGGVAATESLLVKFAENLSARMGQQLPAAVQTLNAEMQRFQTHLQQAQLAVADGGFASGLKVALKDLDNEFRDGSGEGFFRAIGAAMGSLAGAIPLVVNNFGLLIKAAEAFVALKVGQVILQIVTSQKLFGITFAEGATRLDNFTAGVVGLTASLARLRVGVVQTVAALEEMSLAEALLVVRSAAGAVVNSVLTVSLGALRAVMIGVATTARAMWVAIGGVPGLIITALTFIVTSLLGDWIGGVDKATEALAAHESMMEKVRQAYAETNGEADKLKSKLDELSTVQLEIEQHKLRDQLAAVKESASKIQFDLQAGQPDEAKTIAEIGKVAYAFDKGKISAATFKVAVNAIAEANPQLDRNLIGKLLDVADKARNAEQALREDASVLRLLHGTATDADRTLLGLSKTMDKVNASFDPSALDRYNKALLDLQKQIPGLAKIAELQAKLGKVTDDFNAGKLDLAGPLASKDPKVKAQADHDLAVLTAARDQAIAEIQTVAALDKRDEGGGQKYVDLARKYKDDSPTHNKGALTELFGKANFADEKWCADFLNAILKLGGAPGSGSAAAKSFLNYGTAVPNQDARPGDIVVVKNKDGSYHVGIYTGPASNGRLEVIGGNQHGGKVNEESFPAADVVGIRRPPSPAEQVKAQDKVESAQEEFDAAVEAKIAGLAADTKALKLSPRDAFISSKLDEFRKRVDESGPTASEPNRQRLVFTNGQARQVAGAAGQEFDAKAQEEELKKVATAELELNTLRKNGADTLTKAEFLVDAARKDGVDLLTDAGKQYAALKGQIYDLQKQHEAYNAVIGQGAQLKDAQSQLKEAFKQGDAPRESELRKEITDLVGQIKAGLPAAQAFAAALGDQKMVANLQKIGDQLVHLKVNLTDAKDVNNLLANGLTGAFDKGADALGKFIAGGATLAQTFRSIGAAFLQFAADFIKQIAEMIIKQQILNLLARSPIGGSISGFVNVAAGVAHGGGIIGAGTGMSRDVSPLSLIGAMRFHGGGFPGLASDEVATILQRGEEVLSAGDARNALNGGGRGGSSAPAPQASPLKNVILFDAGDVLSAAMKTDVGEKALFTHVRANRSAWGAALGPQK